MTFTWSARLRGTKVCASRLEVVEECWEVVDSKITSGKEIVCLGRWSSGVRIYPIHFC